MRSRHASRPRRRVHRPRGRAVASARSDARRGTAREGRMQPAETAHRPPSVERLLRTVGAELDGRDHDAVVAAAREVVADERARLTTGLEPRGLDELGRTLVERLTGFDHRAGARPVINATGVIVHTNLGRARWPLAAIEAATAA